VRRRHLLQNGVPQFDMLLARGPDEDGELVVIAGDNGTALGRQGYHPALPHLGLGIPALELHSAQVHLVVRFDEAGDRSALCSLDVHMQILANLKKKKKLHLVYVHEGFGRNN